MGKFVRACHKKYGNDVFLFGGQSLRLQWPVKSEGAGAGEEEGEGDGNDENFLRGGLTADKGSGNYYERNDLRVKTEEN